MMQNRRACGRLALAALLLIGCPSQDEDTPLDLGKDAPIDVAEDTTDGTGDDGNATDLPDADTGPELVCGAAPKVSEPFPAKEIGVRITSPSGATGLLYSSATVALGGHAFGDIAKLEWSAGSQSGEITPGFFWQTSGIALDKGDNTIVVTATGANGGKATDRVVITSQPSPLQGVRLLISPDHLFVGEQRTLRFTLSVPLGEVEQDQVNLYATDEQGVDVAPPKVLKLWDDGLAAGADRCDGIGGDKVFSGCQAEKGSGPGQRCFRVKLQLGGTTILTPTTCVSIVARIDQNACLAMRQTLDQGLAAYGAAGDHAGGLSSAQLAMLESSGAVGVAEVGEAAGGHGLWVRFANGALAAVPLGIPEGFRGTPIGSRHVTLLRAHENPDEIDAAAACLSGDICPPFDRSGPHTGGAVSLDRMRELRGNGVIAFSGHGGAYFTGNAARYGWRSPANQEVWWTGEALACEALVGHAVVCTSTSDCPGGSHCVATAGGEDGGECINPTQADLALGRVVIGPSTYGITPSFVDHYLAGSLPKSIVYAGSCYSLFNGSMAMAFLGAGAGAYVGYDGLVRDEFAIEIGKRLFDGLAKDKKEIGEAMCYASDPEHPDTRALMAGSSGMTVDSPGLFNPGFELPGVQGWTVDGDGRRVTTFCGQTATEGKFMGLISTGLGFTDINGSVSQHLCIPEGIQTLTFSWKYYSAELEGTCGQQNFQDHYEVTLKKNDGATLEVLDCEVNDMCHYVAGACEPKPCKPPSDCGCGKCYEDFSGGMKETGAYKVAECLFEGQEVMTTGWIQQVVNVSSLAGTGPVTLTFSVQDKGQATNDTAILLDDIELK